MGRKLIVFADGTGNAYTVRESNVWRLYQALDRSRPDQVARYIRGVGTSGVRLLALLDGATGFGVPSNVRELYRFLCWNWEPGDEIWAFGFSRGAFTIRTLIGLIGSQGLLPARIGEDAVSPTEMRRNAMAAWRAYRSSGESWRHRFVTITLTRHVRDAFLRTWHGALGHRPYAEVQRATRESGRHAPRIRFLGLFDTVEAYGVPLEGLRRAIDQVIWPISFHNRQLSDRVVAARHAMSLDDERLTFHPLLFDRSEEEATPDRIQELWFAGVHSDVGGGYPDDALARVPLGWMAREAEGAGLRFRPGALDEEEEGASPYATNHDSRLGFGVFYRYQPRPVRSEGPGGRDAPVVHHSVMRKILHGCGAYAPVALPARALVRMDGESAPQPISAGVCGAPPAARPGPATTALPLGPTPATTRAMAGLIRRRQAAYLLMVAACLGLAALPFLPDALLDPLDRTGPLAGIAGVASVALGAVTDLARPMIPAGAERWLDALLAHPLIALGLLLLIGVLDSRSGRLRDRIAACARAAWHPPVPPVSPPPPSPAFEARPSPKRPVRRMPRGSRAASWVVLVAVLLGLAFLLHRAGVTLRTELSDLCRPSAETTEVGYARQPARTEFVPGDPCWASGLRVLAGQRYRIEMTITDGFLDRMTLSGLGGFKAAGWREPGDWLRRVGAPFRRWSWGAAWFQPIARIGHGARAEWPLRGVPPTPAEDQPAELPTRPPPLPYASLRQEFTAPQGGELFLYVNDLLPFGLGAGHFYGDNGGRARVILERLP